jgi:hypothetical protein
LPRVRPTEIFEKKKAGIRALNKARSHCMIAPTQSLPVELSRLTKPIGFCSIFENRHALC